MSANRNTVTLEPAGAPAEIVVEPQNLDKFFEIGRAHV